MTQFKRASVLSLVMAIFAVFLTVQSVMAAGTASNTTISNRATISYSVGGVGQDVIESSEAGNTTPGAGNGLDTEFLVDNVINLTVISNGDMSVVPGTSDIALPFTVTNTGNTIQDYALSLSTISASITMDNVEIWIDVDESNSLTAGDLLAPTNNIEGLDPNTATPTDAVAHVIIIADAPSTATTSGITDTYSLTATTLNAGLGTVATETAGADTSGIDIVFADTLDGTRSGQDSANGIYTITSAVLSITKTSAVYSDPINGIISATNFPKAIPGAVVTYTILVSNTGTIDAEGVTIVDAMPLNTDYSPSSIVIDTISVTDGADADAADYNITNGSSVTAVIGTIPASGSSTVTFNVEIQ